MVACIITKDVVVLTRRARISAVLMCARVALACGGVVGVSREPGVRARAARAARRAPAVARRGASWRVSVTPR